MCGCGINTPCFGGCPCGCNHKPPVGVTYYRDSRGFVGGPDPDAHNSGARRVVVIDPKDREQIKRLSEALNESLDFRVGSLLADAVGAALTDTLQGLIPSLKPEQPDGLGAVVEDSDGNRWLIVGGPQEFADEWYSPDLNVRAPWSKIDAVRVLSEGVTP